MRAAWRERRVPGRSIRQGASPPPRPPPLEKARPSRASPMGHGTGRAADSSARLHVALPQATAPPENLTCEIRGTDVFVYVPAVMAVLPSHCRQGSRGGAAPQLAPVHRRQRPASGSQRLSVAAGVASSRLERGSLSPFSYLVLASVRNALLIIMFFLSEKKSDFFYDCFFKWFPGKFYENKRGFWCTSDPAVRGTRWRRPSLSLRSPKSSHGS